MGRVWSLFYLNRGDWIALIEKEVYKQRLEGGESPVDISEKSILRQRPKGESSLPLGNKDTSQPVRKEEVGNEVRQ